MMKNSFEVFSKTLEDVILEGLPSYKEYGLFVWESADDDADLVWIGDLPQVYEEYAQYNVYFVDEEQEEIWLEGDGVSLGLFSEEVNL